MSKPELPDQPSTAELIDAIQALSERVEQLEAELNRTRHTKVGLDDDVAIAISAAVAAFLGHRAKVKQVHYRTGQAWAQQGRAVVQGRHNIHGTR